MPRKKKEETVEIKEKEEKKAKTSTKKTTTTKTKNTSKKAAAKKTTTKKASPTKSTATKATTKKSTSTKSTTKKASTTKSTAKKTSPKKSTTIAKSTRKKSTATKSITRKASSKKAVVQVLEYYDLPYRYNQTVVKVLYQTPTTLFIYWDISDSDRNNFIAQYGNDFFNYTKPVLVIHNETLHYSFEVEIDDFANSWYLHVNDSNCKYSVELGRRQKENEHINIPNNYLFVTSSNEIESPNDRILFDKNLKTVYFRDVKTNIITAENITSLSFMRNIGKIYNLYDLNTDDLIKRNIWQLDLLNPSSNYNNA